MKKNLFYVTIFLAASCFIYDMHGMHRIRSAVSSVAQYVTKATKSVGSTACRFVSTAAKPLYVIPGYFTNHGLTYVPEIPFPPFPKKDLERYPHVAGQVSLDKPSLVSRIKTKLAAVGSKCSSAIGSATTSVKKAISNNKKTIVKSAIALGGLVSILLSYTYWKSKLAVQSDSSTVPGSSAVAVPVENPQSVDTTVTDSATSTGQSNSTATQQSEQPTTQPVVSENSSATSAAVKGLTFAGFAAATYAILGKMFGFDVGRWGGSSN